MMADNRYVNAAADCLLELDGWLKSPVLWGVLAAYYLDEAMDALPQHRAAMLGWLTTVGWRSAEHQPDMRGLAGLAIDKVAQLTLSQPKTPKEAAENPPMKNMVVYGIEGVQGSALWVSTD